MVSDSARPSKAAAHAGESLATRQLIKHISADEIPADEFLYSAKSLADHLATLSEPPLSLIAAGDVMLAGRARRVIAEHGSDYPFRAVLPLLRRSPIIMANLEGPFARKAPRLPRQHSYRVNPKLAHSLQDAGINVVTLANNHLLDCGRAGVLETLAALAAASVSPIGGGVNKSAAHTPIIREAGKYRVGLLGYYWNSRCAATNNLPGSARGTPEVLGTDIRALRDHADRVVVTFHWGVPYDREPSPEDRGTARLAVDCGADIVIGHHQHVVQPFEIYRGHPIFYGVGNFAFGSGNSHAEGLLIGVRFNDTNTLIHVYPLYVKNRDPRVAYQPKVMRAEGADQVLSKLVKLSAADGLLLRVDSGRGILDLRND